MCTQWESDLSLKSVFRSVQTIISAHVYIKQLLVGQVIWVNEISKLSGGDNLFSTISLGIRWSEMQTRLAFLRQPKAIIFPILYSSAYPLSSGSVNTIISCFSVRRQICYCTSLTIPIKTNIKMYIRGACETITLHMKVDKAVAPRSEGKGGQSSNWQQPEQWRELRINAQSSPDKEDSRFLNLVNRIQTTYHISLPKHILWPQNSSSKQFCYEKCLVNNKDIHFV